MKRRQTPHSVFARRVALFGLGGVGPQPQIAVCLIGDGTDEAGQPIAGASACSWAWMWVDCGTIPNAVTAVGRRSARLIIDQ